MNTEPVEVPLLEAERIAYACRDAALENAWAALVHEALIDLSEAERRAEWFDRQVSRGLVQGRFDRSSR